MQRVDGAEPPLGLAAHGADPEGTRRMHPGIVRTRRGIVGFERAIQRDPPACRVADVEAIVGDEELAMLIDPPKRASHHVERMDAGLPCAKPRLEQPALDDVEPPGRIGGGVVGRTLAKMAPFATENGGRHLFHFAFAAHRRTSPGDSTLDCVSIVPCVACVKRYTVLWR